MEVWLIFGGKRSEELQIISLEKAILWIFNGDCDRDFVLESLYSEAEWDIFYQSVPKFFTWLQKLDISSRSHEIQIVIGFFYGHSGFLQ